LARPTQSARFRRLFLALLGGLAAPWSAPAVAQEAAPPPLMTIPVRVVSPAVSDSQYLFERLGKMEQRLDSLMQQNDALLRENQALREQPPAVLPNVSSPGPQGGTGSTDPTASGAAGPSPFEPVWPPGTGRESDSPSDGSRGRSAPTAGGGSKAGGGGDPTTIGRAQEVGNRHLGKVGLNPSYDFDGGGVHFATKDDEFSFAIRGMTQLDGMLYDRPTPGPVTSSGFYNPRSRIYFEGTATKPISWEFSFQNFFDTVQLLDAYVNFNYDERFQVQIGRYKNPFSYEFYRIHIWDLIEPERSLWAVNYEANRRFGLMAHGDLFDERVEYALGTFNAQRNSFEPFNNRQDFQAFLNLKPFYPREEGFLLRNLQFGGSVDLGNEHQSPVPAVLRANFSPGPSTITANSGANAAELPFLAFGPNVLERGGRALWEAHLAYFLGGLSLISAVEGGHESYSNGLAADPVHVPIWGWFVQGAYLLTGETIRDRTLIQPLRPFDLRKGQVGPGTWELTARYSQLDLGSEVFTAGLADPALWTNHAKMVDVGANWYLNQFVKVYFDWEHVMFGNPVTSTNGAFRTSSDLFWVRTQVYF
jgi:phosphate-selective porin OprO/OprP